MKWLLPHTAATVVAGVSVGARLCTTVGATVAGLTVLTDTCRFIARAVLVAQTIRTTEVHCHTTGIIYW